mmetsp:Transcript_59107/g.105095  ORF Transcript_59107/g.105095 Transcript_59107/m.105095 type:complete len:199 (+) Transcript_59107:41-637(+)
MRAALVAVPALLSGSLHGCDGPPVCASELAKDGILLKTPEGERANVQCDYGFRVSSYAENLRCVEMQRVCLGPHCYKEYGFEVALPVPKGVETPMGELQSRKLNSHGHAKGGGTSWAVKEAKLLPQSPRVCEKGDPIAEEQGKYSSMRDLWSAGLGGLQMPLEFTGLCCLLASCTYLLLRQSCHRQVRTADSPMEPLE